MSSRQGCTILLMVFLLGGCATVRTEQEWKTIENLAEDRLGQQVIWEESEAERNHIQQEVEHLLADGLSRQDAVRIALINNRDLQSVFEEIGIAKSDLVQAGLLTNPSLDALFRFPSGGGRTNIDAGLFVSIADLWQIPFRRRVAAARMEAVTMQVAQALVDTAADAKKAFDSVDYLSRSKRESEEIVERFQKICDETAARQDFGFTNDQDVFLAQIMLFEAELDLDRTEQELSVASAHLNRVMGLRQSHANYSIRGEDHREVRDLPNVELAAQRALEHRMDVRMARFNLDQAQRSLAFEKRRVVRHAGLGLAYERETDGTDLLGPGFTLEVPLFDQNQAQISKARYRMRQARKDLEALEGQVQEEVIRDLERIELHQTRAVHYQEKIIPLREAILEYADRWVSAMQINRLHLLEAQRGLLESRREHLKSLLELHHALADLERDMGGIL